MNRNNMARKSRLNPTFLKNKDFWEQFFLRIGNGESLRGVSNDLGVLFQTVWSAIMSDEKRRAAYEDAKMYPKFF